MTTRFFSLAIADGMFPESAVVSRRPVTVEEVKKMLAEPITSCCNPSHALTLDALREKYGIEVPVPEKPPFVKLDPGDTIIVMSARFPRRLNEGEVWRKEDVEAAEFKFGEWTVIG